MTIKQWSWFFANWTSRPDGVWTSALQTGETVTLSPSEATINGTVIATGTDARATLGDKLTAAVMARRNVAAEQAAVLDRLMRGMP